MNEVEYPICKPCSDTGRLPCKECGGECDGCWPPPEPCLDCAMGALALRDQNNLGIRR